ncbi:NADP-dependent oxidoreductase [Pseudomonas sp. NA-150]|uniref:NADP-dependent oxidoreductase n=1 Tax=Pseudomonas sp. NA-150 TaxID=3367525 RepID=UPI0037C79213
MKAIVYRRFGGAEVLEYTDVPDPKVAQNSVLVRVRAAALNPADPMLQAGLGEAHTDTWFPVIPGWDVAGTVERVGAGVSEFGPGDEVIGYIRQEILHHGAYAERVSTPVETLVRKPKNASWAEAAGLPLAGLTAYRAIIQTLNIQPGETLLIHGAAGGVGALAAQLALARGARVIGTASLRNHDYLSSIGALPVAHGVGMAERVRALAPNGLDAVLDCVGKGVLATTAELGSSRVRTCSIADGGPGIKTVYARLDAEILVRLVEMMEAGSLRVPIAATYPLDQAAAAQAALMQPHAPGKIVLII